MRLATALSIAALAISTATIAQVASTPGEQKTGQNGTAGPDTTANTAANDTAGPTDPAAAHAGHDMQDSAMGNTAATTPPR